VQEAQPSAKPENLPPMEAPAVPTRQKATPRRVRREDVAAALEYGARSVPRGEAVKALEALGFKKTAAYRALSPEGRFAELIAQTSGGLIEWKG